MVDGLVKALLEQRQAARERKDYAASDEIRDRLKALGVVVEDTPQGPRWTLAGTDHYRRRKLTCQAVASARAPSARSRRGNPTAGSGGRVRRGLEGRGPTPKAVDRIKHPAHKRAKAQERAKERERSRRPARKDIDESTSSGSTAATRWSRRCAPASRSPRCMLPKAPNGTPGCVRRC